MTTTPSDTLATYRGKPVNDMTRDELIDALQDMARQHRDALDRLARTRRLCDFTPHKPV